MKNVLNGRTESATTSHHKKNRGVPLSYFIRKYTPSTDDRENRYVWIIHQESLVGNMLTKVSRKFIDILKELTLGTDEKHGLRDSSVIESL